MVSWAMLIGKKDYMSQELEQIEERVSLSSMRTFSRMFVSVLTRTMKI